MRQRGAHGRHGLCTELARVPRQLRLAPRMAPEKLERGGIFPREHEEGARADAEAVGLEARHDPRGELRRHALQDRAIEVGLRGEVTVEDELGHAGRGGDVLHRGRGIAPPAKQLRRAPQDHLPPLGPGQPASNPGDRSRRGGCHEVYPWVT